VATTRKDDVPQEGSFTSAPKQRQLSKYQQMMQRDAAMLAYNAQVYANKRASKNWVGTNLSKVIYNAKFVPANSSRIDVGALTRGPSYFVVHRGGINPAACTLINLIREFTYAGRKASTHWVIGKDGTLVQMVDLADAAFHTGTSKSPNNYDSVGAELEGAIGEGFTDAQLNTLANLLKVLSIVYPFTLDRTHIVGHSEILRGKYDPGDNFPYDRVIEMAKAAPSVAKTAVFKPSFDMRDTIQEAASDTLLKASASHSKEMKSLMAGAAGTMNARMRAMNMLFASRDNIMAASASHTSHLQANQALLLANMLHMEDIYSTAFASPQENVTGLLYDFDTGEFND
jgi:N-acetyl-anhydromuramyl-L-alanine amidase AmpD